LQIPLLIGAASPVVGYKVFVTDRFLAALLGSGGNHAV